MNAEERAAKLVDVIESNHAMALHEADFDAVVEAIRAAENEAIDRACEAIRHRAAFTTHDAARDREMERIISYLKHPEPKP